MAVDLPRNAHLPGFDPYAGHGDTGWFGSKIAHAVSHAVSSAAKGVAKGTVAITKATVLKPTELAAKGAIFTTKFAGKEVVKGAKAAAPIVNKALPYVQTVLKNVGPIGMVASGAIGAMKAGLSGKNLESIAWAAAEGAAPSGIDKAIQAAESIRHGGNIISNALSAGVQNFVPGSSEAKGFLTAVETLKRTASKGALGEARRALDSEGAKRAFDAAIGTASKAVQGTGIQSRAMNAISPVLQRVSSPISAVPSNTKAVIDAIKRNPALLSLPHNQVADMLRTNAASVIDAYKQLPNARKLLPWRSMSPRAVSFIRKYHPNAPLTALRHVHTDVSGLDTTGTKYIVEKGDGPWAIAQKLVGNGNRWTELKAVNTDKNPTVDKNVWVGEVLNLPTSWQKPATPAAPPPPAPLPAAPAPSAPAMPALPPAPTPVTDITPSIMQGKAILVAWSKTDGAGASGSLADYGLNVADLSTSMGPRDTQELAAFQKWSNTAMGTQLNTSGNLDAPTLTALQNWGEKRAAGAATQLPATPVVSPVPTASFPPVATLPSGQQEGTGVQDLPPAIPSSTSPATPVVAPKQAPATTANTGGSKIAPMALGAIAGGLVGGLPGALVGAAAGAAIS